MFPTPQLSLFLCTKRALLTRYSTAISLAFTLFATHSMPLSAQPFDVYAAGSLREAMQALESAYRTEQPASTPKNTDAAAATTATKKVNETPRESIAKFLFGPSGKLRERIEAGDKPALFASASPTHTERLQKAGLLRSSNVFAGNALCVMARPGFSLNGKNVFDVLLDNDVTLGTSTPGADPSGDYTWEMFKKIDASRAGAFARLDAKAKKLTGAEINPVESQAAYAKILLEKRADVFVSYCTNAKSAQKSSPDISFVEVPAAFNVVSNYSIGIAPDAPESARNFLRFILSERARPTLTALGFSAPQPKCESVEPLLNAAHTAWTAARSAVRAAASRDGAPQVALAARHSLTLLPAASLSLSRAPAGGKSSQQSGGAVEFKASASEHIEVFADRRAWIDVVRISDGAALESIRSDRWLGCAGVGKNLGFRVTAGERYSLQVSEIDGGSIDVLLMPMQLSR
jgi:molybdate transport system substrate-binding protein